MLALTPGDPAGVGPELVAECWRAFKDDADAPTLLCVGGANVVQAAAKSRGIDLAIERITDAANVADAARIWPQALPVLDGNDVPYTPGQPNRDGAQLALDSLETATKLALDGTVDAVVTAPVSKDDLVAIGFAFPGQTEFFAAACGLAADDAVMMLAGPRLRTVPITVHCALSDVPGALSSALIVRRTRIAAQALQRDFGITDPRIAIAGLNPHAGENGRFGDEEQRIIAPAIAELQRQGLTVSGPIAGDALFTPRARETYDVAICMYHDQALIPLKALDFDEGVNVTLGLPIIRTSPDHGTAFGIAGQNIADPGAMLAAVRMAGECAARRKASA